MEGVLWEITPECEWNLDRYEGYPRLYGKEAVRVRNKGGMQMDVMVYVMNEPHEYYVTGPSRVYLDGIIEGCRQNGIPEKPILEAARWSGKRDAKTQRKHTDPAR